MFQTAKLAAVFVAGIVVAPVEPVEVVSCRELTLEEMDERIERLELALVASVNKDEQKMERIANDIRIDMYSSSFLPLCSDLEFGL